MVVANWVEYEPIGRLSFMVMHFALFMIPFIMFEKLFD